MHPLRQAVISDPLRSAAVEAKMWKTGAYKAVEEYRTSIRRVTDQGKMDEIVAHFTEKVLDWQRFYKQLLKELLDLAKISQLETGKFVRRDGYLSDEETRARIRSAQRCLIYLGDLERYAQLARDEKHRDWGKSTEFYLQAVDLVPSSGNSHNQLAVLEVYKDDHFAAMYRYLKSLSVDEPFKNAKENLRLLFQKNQEQFKLSSPVDIGDAISALNRASTGREVKQFLTFSFGLWMGLNFADFKRLRPHLFSQFEKIIIQPFIQKFCRLEHARYMIYDLFRFKDVCIQLLISSVIAFKRNETHNQEEIDWCIQLGLLLIKSIKDALSLLKFLETQPSYEQYVLLDCLGLFSQWAMCNELLRKHLVSNFEFLDTFFDITEHLSEIFMHKIIDFEDILLEEDREIAGMACFVTGNFHLDSPLFIQSDIVSYDERERVLKRIHKTLLLRQELMNLKISTLENESVKPQDQAFEEKENLSSQESISKSFQEIQSSPKRHKPESSPFKTQSTKTALSKPSNSEKSLIHNEDPMNCSNQLPIWELLQDFPTSTDSQLKIQDLRRRTKNPFVVFK